MFLYKGEHMFFSYTSLRQRYGPALANIILAALWMAFSVIFAVTALGSGLIALYSVAVSVFFAVVVPMGTWFLGGLLAIGLFAKRLGDRSRRPYDEEAERIEEEIERCADKLEPAYVEDSDVIGTPV